MKVLGHVTEAREDTLCTSGKNVVVHDEPVQRDRADFIIFAAIEDEGTGKEWEQIWARSVEGGAFEVCCIPFFAYNLALGDVVAVRPRGDKQYVISDVIRASDHYTFRVWFGSSHDQLAQDEVVDFVRKHGLRMERRSQHLIAIDSSSKDDAQALADFLQQREEDGHLSYDTGRSA